ncbi:hypothetical protein O6H91_05G046800 [Diphasiastrum complanatum]|uniref:Uncharacterized protein n=2 Tax=Diphasiastrum complanatum TaxID=34168 RepID=A0ACC2DMX3_DIPCM|nr:hypothetical protein O6H91_05G046800 [Diphasiastrum complanatum]
MEEKSSGDGDGDGDENEQLLIALLQQNVASMGHSAKDERLRAIAGLTAHLELIKDALCLKMVREALERQLWKEDDGSLLAHIVMVLSSVAVREVDLAAKNSSEVEQITGSAHLVVAALLNYVLHEDLCSSRFDPGVRLQVLRSLKKLQDKVGPVKAELGTHWATEQLASKSPRVRKWALKVLVSSVGKKGCNRKSSGTHRLIETPSLHEFGGVGEHKDTSLNVAHCRKALLQFMMDPNPCVRQAAVDGVVELHKKGFVVTKECYERAVALLNDVFEAVRLSAIDLVEIWVEVAQGSINGSNMSDQVNNAFLQVCSAVTDMEMRVRLKACHALGRMTHVNERFLLQALSKKLFEAGESETTTSIGNILQERGNGFVGHESQVVHPYQGAAGAFVHGLEDEFHEVRLASIQSLANLSGHSEKLARASLEMLLDMLNDDSQLVRITTIHALIQLALADCLFVEQKHLHLIFAVLEDMDGEVRIPGRDLLSHILLPNVSSFRKTIQILVKDFDKHMEETSSMFRALKTLGRRHGSFTACIINELLEEMKVLMNADMGLDDQKCKGLLVLFVAAASAEPTIVSLVPARIFSYANIVYQSMFKDMPSLEQRPIGYRSMKYLWSWKKDHDIADDICYGGSKKWPLMNEATNAEQKGFSPSFCMQQRVLTSSKSDEEDEFTQLKNTFLSIINADKMDVDVPSTSSTPWEVGGLDATSTEVQQASFSKDTLRRKAFEFILQVMKISHGVKCLLEARAYRKALRILIGCKRDLRAIRGQQSFRSAASFASLYVNCLLLVAQLGALLCGNTVSSVNDSSKYLLEEYLAKLYSAVMRMEYCFSGFNQDQQSLVIELCTYISVLQLAFMQIGAAQHEKGLKSRSKLMLCFEAHNRISKVDPQVSTFLEAAKFLFTVMNLGPSRAQQAFELAANYWPSLVNVAEGLKEMGAELEPPNSDSEHTIHFIAGFPFGITILVNLSNIVNSCKLWVRMIIENFKCEFHFVDHNSIDKQLFEERIFQTLLLQDMPKVETCVLKLQIYIECHEDRNSHGRGPQGHLLPLSTEREVYLSQKISSVAKCAAAKS